MMHKHSEGESMTEQPGSPQGPQWGPPGQQPPPGGQYPPQGGPPAQPPKKRKKWPFIVGGVLLLFIIIGIANSGGGSKSTTAAATSTTAAPTTTSVAPAPTTQQQAAAPAPTTTQAQTTTKAPVTTTTTQAAPPTSAGLSSDNGWTLTSFTAKDDGLGDFGGTARIVNSSGKSVKGALIKVTLLQGSEVVATLNGSASDVADGKTVTVQMISQDKYRSGKFTPELQMDGTF